jgi:YVTN family beta-propeller protein
MTKTASFALVVFLAGAGLLAQQQAAPIPKPGVKAVQRPVSMLVPDAEYPTPGGPDWLAAGENQVWTNNRRSDLVVRMDPDTGQTVAAVPVKNPCSGLAIAAGTLWAPSCEEGVIYRIDTVTNQVVSKVPVAPANNEGGIAYGAGSIWMPTDQGNAIARIDAVSNDILATIPVPAGSFTAVYGYGRVWVSSTETSIVSVIHPSSNKVIAEIAVDKRPRFMSAGEGYVWTLNQGTGSVSKIDPSTLKVAATIQVGVPGTGGDIAADEGSVWVTIHDVPLSRIDVHTNTVTHQFVGPGGDGMRVLHGAIWLSNGRFNNVWRIQTAKVLDLVPLSWTSKAQPVDLDRNGSPDLLVEDLDVWFPGQPTTFRAAWTRTGGITAPAPALTLKTTLNGKSAETPFVAVGDHFEATFTGDQPRWIAYRVCAGAACSETLVTASPTTPLDVATKKTPFVPTDFVAPGPPALAGYVWNILEPTILAPDYQALLDRDGRTGPVTITKAEDYGELKRHRWEFQHHTAFAYGVLSPDKQSTVACVYINPSTKAGYDATVRMWVTKQGAAAGVEPVLEKAVRAWIAAKWPFKKVAFPGRDMPMSEWNALPNRSLS